MAGLTMTKKELASVAGYTYRRLYDIDRSLPDEQKLFVPSQDGKYDLGLFVQRWVQYNVSHEMSGIDDLDKVKARHELVKTEKTRLEVERMRGELIDLQDAKRLWGDVANTVMQNFLHLPYKVAPSLHMVDSIEAIRDILDTEIRGVLENIADTPLPAYAVFDDDGKGADGDDEEEEDEDTDGE